MRYVIDEDRYTRDEIIHNVQLARSEFERIRKLPGFDIAENRGEFIRQHSKLSFDYFKAFAYYTFAVGSFTGDAKAVVHEYNIRATKDNRPIIVKYVPYVVGEWVHLAARLSDGFICEFFVYGYSLKKRKAPKFFSELRFASRL